MKVVAYVTLHYGLDYLAESVRSIIDDVNAVWFIYSATPTFGFSVDRPCPDHAADLYEAAKAAAGDKFHWYTASPGQFRHEGDHCDYIYQLAPDADVYVRLDLDEMWSAGLLKAAIAFAVEQNAAKVRVPFVHYWRSFYRAVTNDPAYPDRVKYRHGDPSIDRTLTGQGVIHHFGYAQRSEVVEYKQHISAHRGEWRADWYATKFAPNAQEDVHPVNGDGWWIPADVDPFALGLPEYMREHANTRLEVIP